jgi:hypothetical protein
MSWTTGGKGKTEANRLAYIFCSHHKQKQEFQPVIRDKDYWEYPVSSVSVNKHLFSLKMNET